MTTSLEHDDPWEDRLSEYVDGLLSDPEARALEEHLRSCARCRTALAQLRAVVERLHGDPVDPVPADVWPAIANRLATVPLARRAAASDTSGRASRTVTLRYIATAASLTLTLAGGIWIGAVLCSADSVSLLPGWMHARARSSQVVRIPIPSSLTVPPSGNDSTADALAPLRRSLTALDEQLAQASRALTRQPANRELQRVVVELARQRTNLRALLDSVTAATATR